MAQYLERLFENFSLTKDEELVGDLSHTEDRCILGKLLFGKPFNLRVINGAAKFRKDFGSNKWGIIYL